MLRSFLLFLVFVFSLSLAHHIIGAGATFPYFLYLEWAKAYREETGKEVVYRAIGSGEGIKQIEAGLVDFGASDEPLDPQTLKKKGLAQFPTAMGGVVIAYNLPVKDLKLSTEALCLIFLGKVRYWDDPLIKRDNPDADLPHMKITLLPYQSLP